MGVDGRLPVNHQIFYNMQDIFNLLPNLNVEEMAKSMLVKTNDFYVVIYLAALIRCVMALHDLVNNKLKYRHLDDPEKQEQLAKEKARKEKEAEEKEAEEKEKKDKDGKDSDGKEKAASKK